jgi:hypothetical protein
MAQRHRIRLKISWLLILPEKVKGMESKKIPGSLPNPGKLKKNDYLKCVSFSNINFNTL